MRCKEEAKIKEMEVYYYYIDKVYIDSKKLRNSKKVTQNIVFVFFFFTCNAFLIGLSFNYCFFLFLSFFC